MERKIRIERVYTISNLENLLTGTIQEVGTKFNTMIQTLMESFSGYTSFKLHCDRNHCYECDGDLEVAVYAERPETDEELAERIKKLEQQKVRSLKSKAAAITRKENGLRKEKALYEELKAKYEKVST